MNIVASIPEEVFYRGAVAVIAHLQRQPGWENWDGDASTQAYNAELGIRIALTDSDVSITPDCVWVEKMQPLRARSQVSGPVGSGDE